MMAVFGSWGLEWSKNVMPIFTVILPGLVYNFIPPKNIPQNV